MLAIVIPAHDEEETIAQAILAARQSGDDPALQGEPVEVIVVLDHCTDSTDLLAMNCGITTMSIDARNVGQARATGAEEALRRGARWLAFTDADTIVSGTWLADQLSLAADAVCGSVSVDDWSPQGEHADLLRSHFERTYVDRDDHRHVHGANLGVSAAAYRRAGGFQHLACSEDVSLVRALEASGARIAWSAKPRVATSARREGRAKGGFADALLTAVSVRLAEARI